MSGLTVSANGRSVGLPAGATLADLVAALGLTGTVTAAEHNGVAVPRADHAAIALTDGDRVELVRVMAGG